LEPLAVAIHATSRAAIEAGDTVVVFGAGTVGLLTAAMAKLSGAVRVLVADIDGGRVAYALTHGFATSGHVVSFPPYGDSISERIAAAKDLASEVVAKACETETDFEGADVVFDCTGKEICIQAGLQVSTPKYSSFCLLTSSRQHDQEANLSWSAWELLFRHCKCLRRT
jgi:L-iditol 2-dehydrogenase